MNVSAELTEHADGKSAHGKPRIARADLEAAIRSVEPCAFLVWPRILRRVIKQQCELAALTIRLPHRKSYVVAREPLLEIVDLDELGLRPGQPIPGRVILLPEPSEASLATASAAEVLLRYWRLLLHARIHLELEERLAAGRLTEETIRRRIRQIGPAEFDEIRAVLAQEALLLPPRDEATAYVEFCAVYWELRYFAQPLLPRYFPSVEDFRLVEAVLAEDADAAGIFQATRLPGAPDPKTWTGPPDPEGAPARPQAAPPAFASWVRAAWKWSFRRLIRRAEQAAEVGNLVHSAICRARAEQAVPAELLAKARTALKRDVDRLVRRLQVALAIADEDPHPWQETLLALARHTPYGIWTTEARLLYDLQKVCVDHERGMYRVDWLGWALSLGTQPIQKPLPALREVAISKHLRSAARRLPFVRLTDAERQRLSALLEAATHRAETRLRDRFRPAIARALDQVGLQPRNVPEKVAFRKLVEEMLDRIVEYGYLTMGDLRDALSRNQLKLPDFSWRDDVWRGDPLLQADRRLAASLDGVYRHGEFYLRWMQRLSSLAFGTPVGRLLTRYVAVPYGGTYLVVAFVDHVLEKIAGAEPPASPWSLSRILILGTFVLGLVNVQWFRRRVWQTVVRVSRAARDAVVGLARWIARWEWLKQLVRSRVVRLAYRFALKPLAITGLAWAALGWPTSLAGGVGLFLAVNLLLNSRLGRDVEEVLTDGIVQAWRRLGMPILTGLFYLFVDIFRGMLETVERLLYTVDEWLRFRTGETRMTFVAKGVLGTLWAGVTYVLRFCINLLIEPQINPIKHFPVVTVSHKLLWAASPYFARALQAAMADLAARTDNPGWQIDYPAALALVTSVIWCIPGIFGFLVWELKENWRLYAANRARDLQPAIVGNHGETMLRLLRPGFHSGTVPKLFAKLRRAERRALVRGSRRSAHKYLHTLRRTQLAVRQFVDRELVELIDSCRAWQAGPIAVGTVRLGTNRVYFTLAAPAEASQRSSAVDGRDLAADEGPLEIVLEMRSGWLVSGVIRSGWAARLPEADRTVLAAALAGFYKLARVDLVRQQLEAQLPHAAEWDLVGEGLVLTPQGDLETEVFYPLRAEGLLEPQVLRGELWRAVPKLESSQIVFSRTSIRWNDWVAFWQQTPPRLERLGQSVGILPPR